jgi:hypothetical protein
LHTGFCHRVLEYSGCYLRQGHYLQHPLSRSIFFLEVPVHWQPKIYWYTMLQNV